MSRFHRALVASVSSLAATSAFAQTAEIKPSVTPYGIIQNYLHFVDSQRANAMDSSMMVARIGFKANLGLALGQIEMQATGNTCDAKKSYKMNGTALDETTECADNNRINVRRADVGLAIKASDTLTIVPSFGRVRPGDIGGWGVDATNVTDGFGSMDGAQLTFKLDLGEGNTVDIAGNYGNSVLDPANTSNNILHSGGFVRDHSGDNSRGYVLSAKASISNIKAAFFYGAESNHFVGKINANATPTTATGALTVADFNRWEAALGYDMGNLAAGLTAWQYNTGKASAVKSNEGGKITVGDETGAEASSTTNFGLGVNGDSTLFDVTDVLQKDGKITYGASVIRTIENPGKSAPSKYSTQVAAGVGYGLGGLQIELNLSHQVAKTKDFTNAKGDEPKDSATAVYLSSVYVF